MSNEKMCSDCLRFFDMGDSYDAQLWANGHDCPGGPLMAIEILQNGGKNV